GDDLVRAAVASGLVRGLERVREVRQVLVGEIDGQGKRHGGFRGGKEMQPRGRAARASMRAWRGSRRARRPVGSGEEEALGARHRSVATVAGVAAAVAVADPETTLAALEGGQRTQGARERQGLAGGVAGGGVHGLPRSLWLGVLAK